MYNIISNMKYMIFWSRTIIFFPDNIDYNCQDISSWIKVVTQIVNHIRRVHDTTDIRKPKSNSMLSCHGKTWRSTTLRQIVFSITDDTLNRCEICRYRPRNMLWTLCIYTLYCIEHHITFWSRTIFPQERWLLPRNIQ